MKLKLNLDLDLDLDNHEKCLLIIKGCYDNLYFLSRQLGVSKELAGCILYSKLSREHSSIEYTDGIIVDCTEQQEEVLNEFIHDVLAEVNHKINKLDAKTKLRFVFEPQTLYDWLWYNSGRIYDAWRHRRDYKIKTCPELNCPDTYWNSI